MANSPCWDGQLAQRPSGDVRDSTWRHSLMNWGHDPLRCGRRFGSVGGGYGSRMDPESRAKHDADALRPQQGADTDTVRAAPPGSVPETPEEGGDTMPEVPGGPQVDVPAAQGHLPPRDTEVAE